MRVIMSRYRGLERTSVVLEQTLPRRRLLL